MKLTILLMALWFIVPVFAAGPNPTNVRERVIADMENYRTNVLERGQIGVFDAKDDECADVAKASISLAIAEADPEVRGRLVRTTFRCAKRSWRVAQTTWYTNDAVIMPLIEYYGKYETHDISDSLIELVSPRWLNQHAHVVQPLLEARLKKLDEHQRDKELHLYAMLDSTTGNKIRELFGDSLSDTPWVWVLPRKGDTNAQERLMTLAMAPSVEDSPFPFGLPSLLGQAIGNSGVEKLLRVAARELRSEDYVRRDLNGFDGPRPVRSLRREIWTWAIFTAMRNDADPGAPELTYKMKYNSSDIDEATMDILEQWCTKKYGIEYPPGPRKKLFFIEPGSDPVVERQALRNKYSMVVKLVSTNTVVTQRFGGEQRPLPELEDWVRSHRDIVPVWDLFVPDPMPVVDAINIVEKFRLAECPNLNVFDSVRNINFKKRDIRLVLDRSHQFSLVTPVPTPYAEILDKVGVRRFQGTNDSYRATGHVDDLKRILGIVLERLPDAAKQKHVNLYLNEENGVTAETLYVALKGLEELGITTVSFLHFDRS